MDDTVGAAKKKEVPRPVAADSGLPRDPNGEPLPVPTKGEETLTVVGLADKDDDVVNGTSEKVTDAKGDDKAADDNDDVSNEGSQQSAECMSSAAKIYMTAYFGKSRQTEQEPILYDHGSGDDYSAAGTIDSVASILAARTTQPAGKSSQTNATNGKETAENMFEPNDEDVELAIEPKSTTLNMNDQKPAGRKRVYLVIAALICLLLAVVVIGIVMGLNSTEDSSGDSASIQDESEPPVDEPQTTEPISQTDAPASSSSVTPTSLYGPTNSPTLSPTSTPSFAPSVSLIDPLIEFLQGYQVSVSKDPLSPSYMAVQWLAEEAADIIINGGELVFDDQLVQRFAILALDYSLNRTAVANWTQMTKSENTTKTPAFSPFTMFESVGIKGENECTWPGIICHNDTDIVSEIHFGRLGMSGTISPEVRLLSDLTVFDVAGNSIQGSIPEELYELTLLEEIYLYQNQLTGTISSKIGDLNNVTTIHLSQNLLTGSIPESLRSGNISRPLSKSIRELSKSLCCTSFVSMSFLAGLYSPY